VQALFYFIVQVDARLHLLARGKLDYQGRDQLIIELAKTGFGQPVSRTSACTFAIGKARKLDVHATATFHAIDRSLPVLPVSPEDTLVS